MDWPGIISLVVYSLLAFLGYRLFSKGMNYNPDADGDGNAFLRMPKYYAVLGWVAISIVFFFVVYGLYKNEVEFYWTMLYAFLIFGVSGVPLIAFYQNHRLRFNESSFTVWSWTGNRVSLSWSEVERVKFNSTSGYITFYGSRKKAKVHYHMVGLSAFLMMMENKTSFNGRKLNIPGV